MHYPLNLLATNQKIYPLFGNQLKGEPHVFDFSSSNENIENYDTENFQNFQNAVFDELKRNSKTWGIGKYLEERATLLRNYQQITKEQRFFHLGLDVICEENSSLYAPIDSRVEMAGKEEGVGNYGGYIMLKHSINNGTFYSFYGHLNSNHLVKEGQNLMAGEIFGKLGIGSDSGGWFTHTHLQIITEDAFNQGLFLKGYIDKNNLENVENLFPSPYFLFRFQPE